MKLMTLFPVVLAGAMLFNSVKAADNNVHFHGALVAEPCTLPDTDIKLHFGSVIIKALYQYQRTKGYPFTIHLEDCDPSLMKTVSVTFEGTADDELTTMLALDPSSSAKGVAIGLELQNGTLLPINQASTFFQLADGNNEITFNAFVKAYPSVIANENLIAGDFTAITSFVLNYQ